MRLSVMSLIYRSSTINRLSFQRRRDRMNVGFSGRLSNLTIAINDGFGANSTHSGTPRAMAQ
jgi:hypothetical protein